jgi:hypothetical protein
MALIDGDDFVNGSILSYQEMNRIKNNWRAAAAPANFQPGMILSENVYDRTYIRGAAALVELWSKNSKISLFNQFLNAGFGVWSNSDTAKGLGSMAYDAGSVAAPAIGATLTGATSGATAKIISYTITGGSFAGNNAVGVLALGACTGRFNDNEVANYAGGSVTVNTPPAGVGVDLLQNGEWQTATTGWTAVNCTLASVAGGSVGNCLQITRVGAAPNRAYQNLGNVLVIGKIYKVRIGVFSGTSGNEAFVIQVTDAAAGAGNVMGTVAGISSAGWVFYEFYFEATSAYACMTIDKNTATAGTMLFDEACFYEITPCCTAADALAHDGWTKDATADLYREHNGTNTKDGSFYALKFVPSTLADFVAFPSTAGAAYTEWFRRFAGRTVTVGMWLKTSLASHARIGLYDGATWTYSSYHTGGGTYEWLEVTKAVPTGASQFWFNIFADLAATAAGTSIIYISQAMLAFAPVLGEGNYQPRQEIISFETSINDRVYNNTAGYSTFGPIGLNLEANSEGKIPKGILSVYVYGAINDSGSAAGVAYLYLRKNALAGGFFLPSVSGLTNDAIFRAFGEQPANSIGDVEIGAAATGAGTLDISGLVYKGVNLLNL